MGKITEIPKRLNAAFSKQADLLLLLELAVVMLIATMAANYVFNYSGEVLSSSDAVKSWEYVYTNTPAVQSGVEWEIANSITPLSKEKTGEYLHLRGNIEGNTDEQTIVIQTDYAPIKIAVDGETVYDNHYGENNYVGNAYNAVTLPAANGKIAVEISMWLPFSAEIETYLAKGTADAAFTVGGGLVFSGILLLLGIAACFAAIVLCILKKRSARIFAVSGLITAYGAAVAVCAVSRGSYLFNFSQFYNISIALEFFVIMLFTVTVAAVLKIKDKKLIVCMVLSIVPIVAVLLAPSVLVLKIASLAAVVWSVITVAVLIKICMGLLDKRIQLAKSAFLMLVFLAMFDLVGGIMQATLRFRTTFAFCRLIGEFIFLCYIIFVLAAKMLSNRSQKEILFKTDAYSDCVTKVTQLMRQLLSLHSEKEICNTAAEGICDICREINAEIDAPAYAVFIKENSEYREVCSRSLTERVNCVAIESRCLDSQSNCIFTETYVDLAFLKNGNIAVIFHFENLKNALSPFFTAIMTTLYSGLEVAFARLSGGNAEQAEIDFFTELAYKTETASGNNPDHIEAVARYTDILMETMGYPQEIRVVVKKAAMLHDIGKIAIPSEITNKTGLLSEGEREIIKKHTEYGHLLLSVFDSECMALAAVIASEHHEQYDGKGYRGIKGESINEYVRIVTVADVLDALTAKRSYKEAWPLDQVIEYIDSNSGTLYDPKVVAAMHECMDIIRQIVTEKE